MPAKKGAAALKSAAAEAEKGEGDDVVHAENAATSSPKGKNKAAKRGKRSKNDIGGEDMQCLKKKKVEGKGENNHKGKSKDNLDHLDNVEGLTSSDATSRGTKKNCSKPKRDKIESQNRAEMLARLNIRVNDACDNACNTAGKARRAVFLFAHGAGGTRPRSQNAGSRRYVRILQQLGNVVTFDYPAVDIQNAKYTALQILAAREALRLHPGDQLFLVGHSMGCRGCVNVMNAIAAISTEDEMYKAIRGLILFNYPLHPPKPTTEEQAKSRLAPLQELSKDIKVLFCSADNDSMSHSRWTSMDEMSRQIDAQARLLLVKGGGHGMQLSKQEQEASDAGELSGVDKLLLQAASDFVLPQLAGAHTS